MTLSIETTAIPTTPTAETAAAKVEELEKNATYPKDATKDDGNSTNKKRKASMAEDMEIPKHTIKKTTEEASPRSVVEHAQEEEREKAKNKTPSVEDDKEEP
eukprot:CAMPEP_0116849334 /NCGR_PEP_ID=MMETSP0418-20121206/15514_1 /TAXON_ID=1158023 /ORGANISM="Astrosyne radiata, Strain 13vi08-1A" /LENGTH=101 /DNA_ID=CAMNT_0004481043 /DNA_START=29 /DNA_END=330 /DNA_ORIENTATION=-